MRDRGPGRHHAALMLAAFYERNGAAADVLTVGEVDDPMPGPGEARVRLHTSAVNPSDVKARAGSRPVIAPFVIPDSDGAGVIDRVGEGVDDHRVGDRVWIYNGQWQRPFGTSAQYVTLPANLVVPLPGGLDFTAGACLGIPCMTAHRCLFSDGPIAGQTVLVTGAAGVVGHYAVQLARWGGATVIGTVSSEEKAEHARAAGADLVIDYRREDVATRVLNEMGGVDRVVEVDFGENLPVTARVLRPNGIVASYASMRVREPSFPYYTLMALNPVIRPVFVYTMPDEAKRQATDDIARWVSETDPIFAVAARFPLDAIVDAHETVERGAKIGHVILDIP